jgi:hypothetical protein
MATNRIGIEPNPVIKPEVLVLTFAGLWENWKDPESGVWQRACTIITGVDFSLFVDQIICAGIFFN